MGTTTGAMITIKVPGYGVLKLAHLVLDYNGTLARDGTRLFQNLLIKHKICTFHVYIIAAMHQTSNPSGRPLDVIRWT